MSTHPVPNSALIALAAIVLSACAQPAVAATVTLAWTASVGPDVAGYLVGWREEGTTVDRVKDVGNVTTSAVRNLVTGRTYVFTVRAYNNRRLQSRPAQLTAIATVGVRLFGGAARIPIGQTATWSATGRGFDDRVEYLFQRYSPHAGWVVGRGWSTSPFHSWTPGRTHAGLHLMQVLARQIGSSVSFQARSSTGYFAVGWAPMALPSGLDFDGDGRADLGVFRPSTGTWKIALSRTQYSGSMNYTWGISTDLPAPGDYDGDGRTDLAVFRPSDGRWYILRSRGSYLTWTVHTWGRNGDIPVPNDYDGDGRTDIAVFRPANGTWYVLRSSTGFSTWIVRVWGTSTDVPVPSDYDGDGRTDMAVFRPTTGRWYVLLSGSRSSSMVHAWGTSTDRPAPADYDGDGRADLAVFRPSNGTWYILKSSTAFGSFVTREWGTATDVPVPDDYNGDHRSDVAVFRPANGAWLVRNQFSSAWGSATDIPLSMK
jgi:VCBS repeat protein/fibronectin type III domain protein